MICQTIYNRLFSKAAAVNCLQIAVSVGLSRNWVLKELQAFRSHLAQDSGLQNPVLKGQMGIQTHAGLGEQEWCCPTAALTLDPAAMASFKPSSVKCSRRFCFSVPFFDRHTLWTKSSFVKLHKKKLRCSKSILIEYFKYKALFQIWLFFILISV